MMQKIQQAGGGQKFQALRRWTPPPSHAQKNSLSEKVKAKS